VHDQRVEIWPLLSLEESSDSLFIKCIRAKAIHGLGRKSHEPSGLKAFARARKRKLVRLVWI
jgi:hypothetical protein